MIQNLPLCETPNLTQSGCHCQPAGTLITLLTQPADLRRRRLRGEGGLGQRGPARLDASRLSVAFRTEPRFLVREGCYHQITTATTPIFGAIDGCTGALSEYHHCAGT